MRNHVLYSAVGMALLFLAGGCQKPVVEPPVLTMSTTEYTAPAAGGNVTVAYKVANPVEGTTVKVVGAEEYSWVKVTGVSPNVVLAVEANDTEAERTAELTLSYAGAADKCEFTLVQAAGEGGDEPGPGTDYDFELQYSILQFEPGYGNNGEDNYYVVLSDKPISEEALTQPDSYSYTLDFYVEAGSTSGNELPEGNWPLGAPGETAPMTLGWDYSFFYYASPDGWDDYVPYFSEGSVDVSRAGDVYTLEGSFTDEDGNSHHFVYSGELFANSEPDPEPEPTPDAIEIEATLATALYYSDSDGVMNITMQFTDMTPDAEGYVYPPGSLLQLDVYMPYNEDGRIATGIYDVTEMGGEEYTVATYYSSLTYSPDANTDFSEYGLRSGGTVEISGSPDFGLYNVTCDLVTEDGIPVKCTYEGYLEVSGMSMTTLTGDYELDLEGVTGMAAYYGDAYGTGGANWMFILSSTSGGDGVQVELVGEAADFEAGIPSGEYKPMASDLPSPGEYVPGFIFDNTLYGSWYICTDAQDRPVGYAPAVDGTVKVVNNGDGTYDITFDCVDDAGNVWDGSWTGEIETLDNSQASSYSVKSAKPAGKTLDAKELMPVEEKSEFMNANGLKLAKVQAKPLKESFRLSRMGR